MFAGTLIVTVLTSTVLGFGGSAVDPVADAVYPSVVRQGLSVTHQTFTDNDLRGLGYSVCEALDSGVSQSSAADAMMAGYNQEDPTNPLTADEAAYVIGASVGAYCPSHSNDAWT